MYHPIPPGTKFLPNSKDLLDFEELVHRHRCIFSGQRPSSLYSSKALRALDFGNHWVGEDMWGCRGKKVNGWVFDGLFCNYQFFSRAWGKWSSNWIAYMHVLLFARSGSWWVIQPSLSGIHFPAHDRKAYASKNYTTAEPGYPISNLISGFGCTWSTSMWETQDYMLGIRIPNMNLHTFTFLLGFSGKFFFQKIPWWVLELGNPWNWSHAIVMGS